MAQLSPTEKTAIVMLALGEDTAAEIFRQMNPHEVKKVGQAMSRLGRIDQATVDIVLAEFKQVLLSKTVSGISGSPEFLRNALGKAFKNSVESQELAQDIARANYRMRCFELADPQTLFRILSQEHPQTLAIVLANAPKKTAAGMVRLFPESLRAEVLRRIARLDHTNVEVLQELDDQICKEIDLMGGKGKKLGGVAQVAAILNELQKDGDRVLDGIEDRDPDLSDAIRAEMFRFEDIVQMDTHSLQTLYKAIDRRTWLLALRGANRAIYSALGRTLSSRAAQTLQEDVEALGPQKKSDVVAAQKEVAMKAISLEESGQISLRPEQDVV